MTSFFTCAPFLSLLGFGRGVAVEFAKALSQPLHFVLTGRNAFLLGETKSMVQASRMAGALTTFDVYAADLGDLSTIKVVFCAPHLTPPAHPHRHSHQWPAFPTPFLCQATADRLFLLATKASLTSAVTYDRVIFINNAGSLGPLTYVGTPAADPATYLAHMTSAFGFNVTSSSYLTAELTRRFSTTLVDATSVAIINISSLAAVQVRPQQSSAAPTAACPCLISTTRCVFVCFPTTSRSSRGGFIAPARPHVKCFTRPSLRSRRTRRRSACLTTRRGRWTRTCSGRYERARMCTGRLRYALLYRR